MTKRSIHEVSPKELIQFLEENGYEAYRLMQIYGHLYNHKKNHFNASIFPKTLRELLDANFSASETSDEIRKNWIAKGYQNADS